MTLIITKIEAYLFKTICLLIIASCLSPKRSQYTKITYNDLRNQPIIKLLLPKGFTTERFGTSGTSIYHFYYPDSSVVYIDGDKYYGLNYNNVRASGRYYDLFDKYHSNDSLTLSGKDSNGMFWKNIVIEGYSFGYINVSTVEKKNKLDSCFNNSIKFVRKK